MGQYAIPSYATFGIIMLLNFPENKLENWARAF